MEFNFNDFIDENTDEISMSDLRGDRVDETNGNYVAIDIETTGFAYRDDIIEIAAIKVENDSVVDTFQTLIKPTEPIPVNITALTGIDNEMIKGAPSFDNIIESFISFIGNYTIMGHNVIFDLDRLNNKLYNKGAQTICNCYIDTMDMAKNRINSLNSYNLINIANYLNVKIDISHRALSDCYTTIKCYDILKNMPINISYYTGTIRNAYHFLNKCYPIPYKNPDEIISARGMVYFLIGEPYYSSISLFRNIMHTHGAKGIRQDYNIDADHIMDLVQHNINKLTHIVISQDKHGKVELPNNFYALIQQQNISMILELDLYKRLGINTSDFPPVMKQKTHLKQKDVVADSTNFNENHPLYGKTVVITGSLNKMPRREAYQQIKNVGGLCGDNITKITNYLVTNSTAKTGKMKKALQYIDEGYDIKIINEYDLYNLLGL